MHVECLSHTQGIVNGGVVTTLLDCHGNVSRVAAWHSSVWQHQCSLVVMRMRPTSCAAIVADSMVPQWTAAIALMDKACLPRPPLTLTASMTVCCGPMGQCWMRCAWQNMLQTQRDMPVHMLRMLGRPTRSPTRSPRHQECNCYCVARSNPFVKVHSQASARPAWR